MKKIFNVFFKLKIFVIIKYLDKDGMNAKLKKKPCNRNKKDSKNWVYRVSNFLWKMKGHLSATLKE